MDVSQQSRFIAVEETPAVVVSEKLEDLIAAGNSHNPIYRILLSTQVPYSTTEIISWVNSGSVNLIVTDPEKLQSAIDRGIEWYRQTLREEAERRSVREQNEKLERASSNVDRAVMQKTSYAEEITEGIQRGVVELKQIISYYEKLVDLVSIDQFLELLKVEIRHFGLKQPPILTVMHWDGSPMRYWFQGQMLSCKRSQRDWSPRVGFRKNNEKDLEYLVAEFGRPFAKVLAIPLVSGMEKKARARLPPTFFFEHSMSEEMANSFLKFLTPRLEPAVLALDKLLLDMRLRQSTQLWAKTFNAFHDPLAIISSDYRTEMANREFLNGDQRTGEKCHKILFDFDQPCTECPLQQTFATSLPQQAEIVSKKKTYHLNSYPIQVSGEGRPLTVVHHYQDMTVERELQGRMIQNEKMAELGRLAGHIAHELNNPLTGIRSMAQVILKSLPPTGPTAILQTDFLEVENAAARSQKIIENLIDFAQGGSSHATITCPLNELVSKTMIMIKTAMREHSCDVDLTSETTLVRVEPHMIQQVIFNLINNACQAMQTPGQIRVETRRILENDKVWIEFSVSDTGPGIPEEVRLRLFEPFYTTKEAGKGTGLGLSLSQKIVSGFGGQISFSSTMGQGSEFRVRLPEAGDE